MPTANFAFTGAAQSFVVPAGVTQVLAELWGGASNPSRGGYRRVLLPVTPGETLQINVGEGGRTDGTGAFNGGAPIAGAGATDVRRGGTTLASRVAVAGGAGGYNSTGYGRGGAATGQIGSNTGGVVNGVIVGGYAGGGGTQSAGGAGGAGTTSSGAAGTQGAGGGGGGDTGTPNLAGGGGGGWYGGGGAGYYRRVQTGGEYPGGGGGGSNGGSVGGAAIQADERSVASPDGSLNGYARLSYGGAVTASADSDNVPPRAIISLLGFSLATTATVYRVDANGNLSAVRSFNPVTLSGGSAVGYDYEAPLNQPVTYRAVGNDGTTIDSQLVTVTATVPWLIHPGVPDFSLPVPGVLVPDEETSDIAGGVMWAMGRAEGVPENDGVRHTPTFELTIRTGESADLTVDAGAETAAVDRILADGTALLLQITYDWTDVVEYRWIQVGTVRRQRRTRNFADLSRNFVLECTVVAAPAGVLQAQWTLNDVAATYATLNDVRNAYATLNDLTLDNRQTS